MTEIDRRAFLQTTGMLAAGAFAGKLKGHAQEQESGLGALPAPNYEPFEWSSPGQVFSFEFLDKRLRFRTLLPEGVSGPPDIPAPSDASGVETSIHCTGENPDDHHGLKLTGGSPGARLVFLGKRETATTAGRRLILYHSDPVTGLRVESIYEIVRERCQWCAEVPASQFAAPKYGHRVFEFGHALQHSAAQGFEHNSASILPAIHGRLKAMAELKPSQAGFIDNGNLPLREDFRQYRTWSTQRYLPLAMIENTELGVTWFWQIEHNGTWHWELCKYLGQSRLCLYWWAG